MNWILFFQEVGTSVFRLANYVCSHLLVFILRLYFQDDNEQIPCRQVILLLFFLTTDILCLVRVNPLIALFWAGT